MLKNKWFLVALGFTLVAPMWAAKGLSLYTGKATYTYAYPATKAAVTEKKSGSRALLSYQLAGDVASGAGVGIPNGNLAAYRNSGALQFFVSGVNGGEAINVGLTMAGQDGKKSYAVMLPLGNYATIKKGGWSKVTIPLADFPAQGNRWNAQTASNDSGAFNWGNVAELTVVVGKKSAGPVRFFLTSLNVVPSYNGAALKAARKRVSQVSGVVTFLSSAGPGEGVGPYAYPEGKASTSFRGGKLLVKLDDTVWSGGGLDHSTILDLSASRQRGKLLVQAAGIHGGEVINLGLRCKSNGAGVQVSINSYLPGGLKKGHMAIITIPLADFSDTGSSWDAAAGKNIEKPFDWSSVNQVLFDNNGPGNGVGSFYLGSVQIKP